MQNVQIYNIMVDDISIKVLATVFCLAGYAFVCTVNSNFTSIHTASSQ